jgi:predicted GIY-YIG superfamily endonuclease
MFLVYLMESIQFPNRVYIGLTSDLDQRLQQHHGGSEKGFTAKYRPWKVVVAIQFEQRSRAEAFEKYLKSGSGHRFAKRHFWGPSAPDRSPFKMIPPLKGAGGTDA